MGFTPVLFRHGSIGTILLPHQGCMIVFLELLDDVAWHRNVEHPRNIVPVEANTAVLVAVLSFGEFIFFFDASDKVSNILLAQTFHALSTTSVKGMGGVSCFQRPGVYLHSK